MLYMLICCMEDILPQAICSKTTFVMWNRHIKGLILIKYATRHDNSIKHRDALSKCQICLRLDWLPSAFLHVRAPVRGTFLMVSACDLCFADNLAQQSKVKKIGRDAIDYWLALCYLFTKKHYLLQNTARISFTQKLNKNIHTSQHTSFHNTNLQYLTGTFGLIL